MPTLRIRFPGGRYHATPWGHHVNEGLVEWPPSPWRLLRALLACGFSSRGWNEVPPVARCLIEKMATVLPKYRLPEVSVAHSRHFMPIEKNTTLVFDTWANVGDGELLIYWPCELNAEERVCLDELVSALGYLGRSESWVEGELLNDDRVGWNAEPCSDREQRGPGWEQVALVAAHAPSDYLAWRAARVEMALRPFQGQKVTATVKKKREKAMEPYPADLLSCLTTDTDSWKSHGWSQPPGSQRVLYWRCADSLEVGVPVKPNRTAARPVEMMLLALTTPTGNRSPLPSVTRTLPQAEIFHDSFVRHRGEGRRVDCPVLIGKDADNRPLRSAHTHAHTLPLDLDGDGRIDHVLVFARMLLDEDAQQAIRSVKRTWTKGGGWPLQVATAGTGGLSDLRRLPMPMKSEIDRLLGPIQGSTVWESVTPFVPPRFLKSRGINTLEGQVRSELHSRGYTADVEIQIDKERTRAMRHFVIRRNHGGEPPKSGVGYGLRLVFSEPVCGPMLLGYASHFGLGKFATVARIA